MTFPSQDHNSARHESSFNPYTDNGGSSLAIAGHNFCVVASDTRQSDGYLINSRDTPKAFCLPKNYILCTNGFNADGKQFYREVMAQMKLYSNTHCKDMKLESAAQLISILLYYRRFFPYYTFNLLGGIDSEGKGAVYSYDPVGSFERESYRAGGSAASLIQPFLDSVVGQKNRTSTPTNLTVENAIKIAKDAFSAAAERDIQTGDYLDVWILHRDSVNRERFQLRKD